MNGIVKKGKYVTETIFTYSKSVLEIVKKQRLRLLD